MYTNVQRRKADLQLTQISPGICNLDFGLKSWDFFYELRMTQWLEHLQGKRKVLGSIPRLGKHFSPKYECSWHQEQSLKSLWMIGEDLRRSTLAQYTRCNVWLRHEDHQLRLENFDAPSFPQMGHWNSVLCSSRLNLDSTRMTQDYQLNHIHYYHWGLDMNKERGLLDFWRRVKIKLAAVT